MKILSRLSIASALVGASFLVACSSSGDDSTGTLTVTNSSFATVGANAIAIEERWFVFLADEADTGATPVGTDLNGDADTTDSVPTVINIATGLETSLAVAAQQIFVANAQVYMVVNEGLDGRNWETPSDLGTNDVLLHWSASAGTLTYIDTLEDLALAQSGTNLFYASLTASPTSATESNIRAIDAAGAPLTPVAVPTNDATSELEPIILGEDEGIVFLALDEVGESRDLNTDGDSTDVFVLALLNGTTVAGTILNTELAVQNAVAPFRANNLGPGDWLIGFLVSEADQGGVSLNDRTDFDAAWQPTQCGVTTDTDATDQVLHYLTFASWVADPVMNPIRNTGLAGIRRVVTVSGYVGTVSPEADASCDLNNDGDSTDEIFRWTEAFPPASPIVPTVAEDLMRSVFNAPGGANGVAELDNRWVLLVDEAADGEDIDGDGMMDDNLVGWYNPSSSAPSFTFTPFVGATWMAEQADRSRLPLGFLEEYTFASNGDGDTTDTFPAWADFDGGFTTLVYPGVARAVEPTNVGLVVTGSLTFFRVSEADDNVDWNGDGNLDDHILFRSGIVPSFVSFIGDVTNDTRPVIEIGSPTFGGALMGDEPASGSDLNGDTDGVDDVLRYFRF